MAARFLVAGGDGNWGSTNNWSTTSGGGSGASVPVATDDVTFDTNSGATNLTINTSARACLSLTITSGYTGTLTFSQNLTVTNNVTLGANMVFAGASTLIVTGTCTFTSNGKTVGVPLTFSGGSTATTLADNMTTGALLTITPSTGATKTFTGNTLNINSSLTVGGGAGSNFTAGTTAFVFAGTGTWQHTTNTVINNSVTINTAGTLTVSGVVRIGTGGITYTTGTVVTTGSNLVVLGSATLNINGVTWNDFNFNQSGTWTLASDIQVSGTLFLNPANATNIAINGNKIQVSGNVDIAGVSIGTKIVIGTTILEMIGTGTISRSGTNIALRLPITINTAGTITISGTIVYNTGTITYTAGTLAQTSTGTIQLTGNTTFDLNGLVLEPHLLINTAGAILSLASDLEIHNASSLVFIGTAASPVGIQSTSGGVQRELIIQTGTSIDIGYCNATDIDGSNGEHLVVFKGTLSNTLNWSLLSPYDAPYSTGGGGVRSYVS